MGKGMWKIGMVIGLFVLPSALAHEPANADIDLDASAGLDVVARAKARVDAKVTYEWDWGDGTATTAGARARHTYEHAGEYVVRLTYEAEDGRCWTEERTVRVVAEAERPTKRSRDASANASATGRVGGALAVDASLHVGRAQSEPEDESLRSSGRVRASSSGRSEVPAPGAALLVAVGVGAAAFVRRR